MQMRASQPMPVSVPTIIVMHMTGIVPAPIVGPIVVIIIVVVVVVVVRVVIVIVVLIIVVVVVDCLIYRRAWRIVENVICA